MPKTHSDLSPRMQLWVTAVSLVVGFLCGLSISFFSGFGPSLQKLAESEQVVERQNSEILRLRQQEAHDHEMLGKLAERRPEVWQEILGELDAESRAHVNDIQTTPQQGRHP